VPAAAVIPAPIAYTKVVAVKKLVVEIVSCGAGPPLRCDRRVCGASRRCVFARFRTDESSRLFTLNKLECSKRADFRLNIVRME
jgi:hypothetical protein